MATSVGLDPAWDIPPRLDGSILEDCMNFREFNLWVESMEYYDDLNIAITVRRGTIQALYNIMSGGKGSSALGRAVIYFLNTQDMMNQVRESKPWTVQEDALPVVSGSGVLCPALRFLPSVGTFISESAVAVVYGLKYAVNLLANPFALNEILINRQVPPFLFFQGRD